MRIATLLQGKHRRDYNRWKIQSDNVIVINSSRTKVTYQYLMTKFKLWHSRWPGGLKRMSIRRILNDFPNRLIEDNVRKCLPRNKLRDKIMINYLHVNPFNTHSFSELGIPQITMKEGVTSTHQYEHSINTQKKAMLYEIAKSKDGVRIKGNNNISQDGGDQ